MYSEIKSRFVMLKVAFKKKKNRYTRKLDLSLRKRLVRCCIWSMVPKLGRFGNGMRNASKVLKCGARAGWR
jgi:hypothetical protein